MGVLLCCWSAYRVHFEFCVQLSAHWFRCQARRKGWARLGPLQLAQLIAETPRFRRVLALAAVKHCILRAGGLYLVRSLIVIFIARAMKAKKLRNLFTQLSF